MKTISNEIIRTFNPCYDPSKKVKDETEVLSVVEWVEKYRNVVPAKDIIWLLCRNEFMNDRDLRLFAVFCAREALKLDANPDPSSVNACNVAERFANGDATIEELAAARAATCAAARAAACAATCAAARAAACAAAWAAARDAAWAAAWAATCAVAMDAAWDAAWAAVWAAERDAARAVARAAEYAAARDAARDAARGKQLDKLLTFF